jgi:hypothetical protein
VCGRGKKLPAGQRVTQLPRVGGGHQALGRRILAGNLETNSTIPVLVLHDLSHTASGGLESSAHVSDPGDRLYRRLSAARPFSFALLSRGGRDDMTREMQELLNRLATAGWKAKLRRTPETLPSDVIERYEWIPLEVREFVGSLEFLVSPQETAWFLTPGDFSGISDSAFRWNQWELDSIAASEGDRRSLANIVEFWNQHFPLVMSVKNGYAFFAIERTSLAIVSGEEPEFEDTSMVAPSLDGLLQMIDSHDLNLSRWI